MKAQKIIFLAILAVVLAIPQALAEDYVILTPGAGNYYNEDFNQTAMYINTTLADAAIVRFTTMPDAAARSNVAAKSPKYIYLVVQAANLTPGFLNDVDNLTKYLDSDPYVDAAWSVITGYDNISARDMFNRSMDSSWTDNFVFIPASNVSTNAQVAAGNIIASRLGRSAYLGASVLNTTVSGTLAGTSPVGDFIYFSGNATNYTVGAVNMFTGDNGVCPAATISGALCVSAINVERILFFADTSDSGRVNGSNTDTTWLNQNPAANYSVSLPIAFSRQDTNDKGAAYIGPHSTRWVTAENVAKNFVASISTGKDIVSALRFAKNMLLFNKYNESLSGNFADFVESEYNLFGAMQKPSSSPASAAYTSLFSRVHDSNPVIYSGNVTNITWVATATVSTPATSALYTQAGWQSSTASAWYTQVSGQSGGKINMSILAAVLGEIKPDTSALRIINYSGAALSLNLTGFNISVNQSGTDYLANDSLSDIAARRYDSDGDRIYFARLFSPNESVSQENFAVNMTYITEGVQINRTTITGTKLNATMIMAEGFDAINPADAPVSGATLLYALPFNLTTACAFSGSNCSLIDSGNARYANVTIASLASGTNSRTMQYNTTLDVNSTANNADNKYNRGETLAVTSNVTAPNYTVLDYNVKLAGSDGVIAWSNSTEDIVVSEGIKNTASHTYAIPQNATSGVYALKTYYISNGTSIYASYEAKSIQITDFLNLTNVSFASNEQNKLTKYYFSVNDSMTATGNVYDVHNGQINLANVTISLIGDSVENATSKSTDPLGVYSAPFMWTNSPVGSKILQVVATYNNNTGRQNDTIYITRYLGANLSVTFDGKSPSTYEKKYIYYYGETPKITAAVKDPAGLAVYKANVTLLGGLPGVGGDAETAANGSATKTFTPAQTGTYLINVSANSPLNTSKTIYNGTYTIYIMWITKGGTSGHLVTNQNPSSAIVNSPVTISGNLTISYSNANDSLITEPSVAFQLRSGGSDVSSLSSCGSVSLGAGRSFAFTCTPKTAGDYQADIQASLKYDGVIIRTNDTYPFSATVNTTTPASSTTTLSTVSSQNNSTCTKNSDCSSGDACKSGVCTKITCTDGAIVDHVCVANKKINITSYSSVLEVEQGASALANFTISNTGFAGLTGVTFTLYLPSTLSWTNWYSTVTALPSSIDASAEKTAVLNITVPANASIEQHSIRAKITTKEGITDEKTFSLKVTPSAKNRDLVKVSLTGMDSTINDLTKEVERVMKGAPEDARNLTQRKLDAILLLFTEAEDAVSSGKYFDAYTKQKELSDMISDLKVVLADQKAKSDASKSRRNMIAGVVIILAAIAGGFYYLWTPATSGYHPEKGYSVTGKEKAALEKLREDIKKKISDLISKLKGQKEGAVATSSHATKYDYLRHPTKRW